MPSPTVARGGSRTRGCLSAIILAAVFMLITGLAALFVGGDDDGQQQIPSASVPFGAPTVAPGLPGRMYPDRQGALPTDLERRLGEAADVGGVQATPSATVTSGSIVADVSLRGGAVTRPYDTTHWTLQTPTGQMLDPTPGAGVPPLGSGQLSAGGTVSGKVGFNVGPTSGAYYLIWTPDPAAGARGVWEVAVS